MYDVDALQKRMREAGAPQIEPLPPPFPEGQPDGADGNAAANHDTAMEALIAAGAVKRPFKLFIADVRKIQKWEFAAFEGPAVHHLIGMKQSDLSKESTKVAWLQKHSLEYFLDAARRALRKYGIDHLLGTEAEAI